MQKIVALMQRLNAAFPPPPKCAHSLHVTGQTTTISVWVGKETLPMLLSAEDLSKSADELFEEIRRLVEDHQYRELGFKRDQR